LASASPACATDVASKPAITTIAVTEMARNLTFRPRNRSGKMAFHVTVVDEENFGHRLPLVSRTASPE
jgi:hypothetical protein